MTAADPFPLQLWSREYPKALQEQRVAFLPLDFFREGPVKNQDVYYVGQFILIMNFTMTFCLLLIRCVR